MYLCFNYPSDPIMHAAHYFLLKHLKYPHLFLNSLLDSSNISFIIDYGLADCFGS